MSNFTLNHVDLMRQIQDEQLDLLAGKFDNQAASGTRMVFNRSMHFKPLDMSPSYDW